MAKTVKDIALIMDVVELDRAFLSPLLDGAPLRGIQVGVIYDPEQPANVQKMAAFKHVVKVLQSSGTNITDGVQLPGLEEYLNLPERLKTLVMETDFKISMEAYLQSLASNPNRLTNLNDLMEAIKNDPQEKYPERNIAIMESASRTSTRDPDYLSMLRKEEYFGGPGGLEGALDNSECRVLISPAASLTFQRFAAMGGSPVISVPIGVYPEGTPIEHDKTGTLVTVAPGIP